MHKYLILMAFVFAIPFQVRSDESGWTRIFPVAECRNFHMLYHRNGNHYYLTYPVLSRDGRSQNYRPYLRVQSINDLSSIADVIEEQVAQRCQRLIPNPPEAICNPLSNLAPEFVRLIQDASNAVAVLGDSCQEITRYIELHDRIAALDSRNPVQIEGASNFGNMILKIFADSTNDRLINHYEACGGKDASHRFIENLLLIESHNSCIMPAPPGVLSWDEMRAVARRVAARHRNKSILRIRDDQPAIEREALLEITRVASIRQIRELVPGINAEQTLQRLAAYRRLQANRNMSNLQDYIQRVYTVDVAIELSEISLNHLVHQEMTDKLPSDWSADRKRRYINNELMPVARAGYNECMAEPKRRTNYGHRASGQVNLNYRNWQRNEFCRSNVSHCRRAERHDCRSSEPAPTINLLSMDPDISDADLAKSCVLNGIIRTVRPLLNLTMETQVAQYRRDVDLPEDMTSNFSNVAWNLMKGCVNTHRILREVYHNEHYQPIYYGENQSNSSPLVHLSPDQFTEVLGSCSDAVENQITRDFVEAIFIANENVHSTRTYGPLVNFHGRQYHAEAVTYTQEVVDENLDACYASQNRHHPNDPEFRPNPALCTPLLEIVVAKETILDRLRKTFNDASLAYEERPNQIMRDFTTCADQAKTHITATIGHPTATPSLREQSDGTTYLERDNRFYQCVEDALVRTSSEIAAKRYRDEIRGKRGSLQNYRAILGWSDEVAEVVSSCFQREMDQINSWNRFKEANEAGALDQIEERCGNAANRYALPRIMLAEATSSLRQLQSDELLDNNSEITLILSQAAQDIRRTFRVQNPDNLRGVALTYHIFAEGMDTYLQRNPNRTLDDYLNYFERRVTSRAVEKIRGRIVEKIKRDARRRHNLDLSALDQALPNQCILDLYNNLKSELESDSSEDSSESLELNDIITQLVDGFKYVSQLPNGMDTQMREISNFCANARNFRNLDQIKNSGILDMVVKAQVQQKVYQTYMQMVEDAYQEERRQYSRHGYYGQIRPFIEKKYNDMKRLIRDQIGNIANFDRLMFPSRPSPIINYALENLDDATKEGSAANRRLNQLVVEQMFRNRTGGSFASRFAEIQIVNTVGISGFFDAQRSLWDKVRTEHSSIRDTAYRHGMQSLQRNWTVQKVHDRFGWNTLPDFARGRLIDSLYDHAVLPEASGRDSAAVAREREQLTADVSSHLNGWHRAGKTFPELFADEIAAETEDSIWDSPSEAAGEAIRRWLTF